MKIGLGTVQFGLPYGIAGPGYAVNKENVSRILSLAGLHGVDTLDTASTYGESETVLGNVGISDFRVVTKVFKGNNASEDWVEKQLRESLRKLRVQSLYGVLFHRAEEAAFGNNSAWHRIRGLKEKGLVRNIGVSVYSEAELDRIVQEVIPDLIQIPVNVFDQRLIESKLISDLKANGCEIHARSIFLQGLLLQPALERNQYFNRWSAALEEFDRKRESNGQTAIAASLQCAILHPFIDRCIVGVQRAEELQEILDTVLSLERVGAQPWTLPCEEDELINPGAWRLM